MEVDKIRQTLEGNQLREENSNRWPNYLKPIKNFASNKHLWDYLTSGGDNTLVANEGISMLELFSPDFVGELKFQFCLDHRLKNILVLSILH